MNQDIIMTKSGPGLNILGYFVCYYSLVSYECAIGCYHLISKSSVYKVLAHRLNYILCEYVQSYYILKSVA